MATKTKKRNLTKHASVTSSSIKALHTINFIEVDDTTKTVIMDSTVLYSGSSWDDAIETLRKTVFREATQAGVEGYDDSLSLVGLLGDGDDSNPDLG